MLHLYFAKETSRIQFGYFLFLQDIMEMKSSWILCSLISICSSVFPHWFLVLGTVIFIIQVRQVNECFFPCSINKYLKESYAVREGVYKHWELSLLKLFSASKVFMIWLKLYFTQTRDDWVLRDNCFFSRRSVLNVVRLTPSGWVWPTEFGSVLSAQENTEAWEFTSGQPFKQTMDWVGLPQGALWLWTEFIVLEGCRMSQFQHFTGSFASCSSPKWPLLSVPCL